MISRPGRAARWHRLKQEVIKRPGPGSRPSNTSERLYRPWCFSVVVGPLALR